MERELPENLLNFLKNAFRDVEDGYEYASELNRILNSDSCQLALKPREIELLRDYSDDVRKVGDINPYNEERIREIECEHFGSQGISGFLQGAAFQKPKPVWPF